MNERIGHKHGHSDDLTSSSSAKAGVLVAFMILGILVITFSFATNLSFVLSNLSESTGNCFRMSSEPTKMDSRWDQVRWTSSHSVITWPDSIVVSLYSGISDGKVQITTLMYTLSCQILNCQTRSSLVYFGLLLMLTGIPIDVTISGKTYLYLTTHTPSIVS